MRGGAGVWQAFECGRGDFPDSGVCGVVGWGGGGVGIGWGRRGGGGGARGFGKHLSAGGWIFLIRAFAGLSGGAGRVCWGRSASGGPDTQGKHRTSTQRDGYRGAD